MHIIVRHIAWFAGLLGVILLVERDGQANETTFRYTLAEAGRASLAVYDAQGRMVRPVCYGEEQAAGEHTYSWDGLDRYGVAQPAGEYQWRLLRTPGFSRELLCNVGVTHEWSPFDVWPGNHFGPGAIYVDADDALYVASQYSEGPPHLIKVSANGTKKFWDDATYGNPDGIVGLARVGDVLCNFYTTTYTTKQVVVKMLNALTGNILPHYPKAIDVLHAGDNAATPSPMSFAGGGNYFVVTYRNHNEVRFVTLSGTSAASFAKANPSVSKDVTYSVPSPGRATVTADGRTFVVSESDVLKIDPATGATTRLVADLPGPLGSLAYDAHNDDLLIVCGNCIRRYHSDGQMVAVHGETEGRSYGRFNPLDFDGLLDIACDSHGDFYTVETFPRRVAHFTGRAQHTLVNQWLGGFQWGSMAAFDPADPTIAYVPIDYQHWGKAKLDFSNKSWVLTDLYPPINHSSWAVGKTTTRDILPAAPHETYFEVRHIGGETFLVNKQGSISTGQSGVLVLRVDADQLTPVAYLGCLHPTLDAQTLPPWWLGAQKLPTNTTFNRAGGYTHFAFSWSDKNGNGQVDTNEIQVASVGNQYAVRVYAVDAKWNITLTVNGKQQIAAIANEGTATRPRWNWDRWKLTPLIFSEVFAPSIKGVYAAGDGTLYAVANNTPTPTGSLDTPPLTWPNNTEHSARLMRFNASGRQTLSAGVHNDLQVPAPGGFAEVRAILGEVSLKESCLLVLDAVSHASVWTTDGLYAGSFQDDAGYKPSPLTPFWERLAYGSQRASPNGNPSFAEVAILWNDAHWGQVFQDASGTIYWGSMAPNSTPLYRIGGFEGWQRQNGRLTIAAPPTSAKGKGTGLTGTYYATSDLTGSPVGSEVDAQIAFGNLTGGFLTAKGYPAWPAVVPTGGFSAEWMGEIELPLGEPFVLRAYTLGDGKGNGAQVRIWANREVVLDAWSTIKLAAVKKPVRTVGFDSKPLRCTPGEKLSLKIEFASTADPGAHLHLYWQSASFDLRHVPRKYLYPGDAGGK